MESDIKVSPGFLIARGFVAERKKIFSVVFAPDIDTVLAKS
jgi:hypothetical protein